MHRKHLVFLLYMCTTAVTFSLAFNIDLRNPDVYNGSAEDFFGYKVLQVGSQNNKGIIVTAPLFMNGTGAVYRRGQNQTQDLFKPQALPFGNTTLPVKHFGLSIAKNLKQSLFTVCSPNVVMECFQNSYINSVCYNLTDQLQALSNFTPTFKTCTKKIVDLVFLFDGSRSMLLTEFEKNKEFIFKMMTSLQNTSIKFAAVQFSADPRTVFTFNDYSNGDAIDLLKKEPHMQSLTNTHRALRFVMQEHFENISNGASPEATKVLVLITDGDPSDADSGEIQDYDSKNIIRVVIGVKMNDLTKVMTIASEPKMNNTFPIESYDGLTGVLQNFEKKIFQTEGTKTSLAGDLTEEMSQTGFSTVYSRDTLLLGSVGSNTWRGSLHERQGQTVSQIIDPLLDEDSYMGYSVSVGERNKTVLYFTGAPRYNHVGQALLFKLTGADWIVAERVNGEEHGSYFGAEVCSVDVDSDGSTDFLLVGAPLFYQPHEKREGKIYVYTLTDQLKLIKQLNVTAPALGRFGSTITSVADLNGDRLRDVAVGAPLENHHRGAVYIYLGHRTRGIRSTYSQRIMGEKVHPELRFFGQSIDGSSDPSEDSLPDLVIGSRGAAIVLRSKPVFNVSARLSFEPHEISTEKINCPSSKEDFLPLATLRVCFEMVEATNSTAGAVAPRLNISYTLAVDPMRQTFRGFFNSSTKNRNTTEMYELRLSQTCVNHSVFMPKCITDTLSAVNIKMNFSQVDSETAAAVLNSDSTKEASVEVPFERRCKNNDTCVAELEVDFNFTTPTLLVSDNNYFNVTTTLWNRGEDSYNTSLTIHHPPGLSFSRNTLTQESKSRPLYSCEDSEGGRMTCGISLPVYRSESAATFTTVFHVIRDYDWKDTMSMTITGNSDNQNSTKGSLKKEIPVQFEIKMMLLIGNDAYLNFTTEKTAPKTLITKYTVHNHGWMSFPVNVTLFFPTKLEHNFEMNNYNVSVEPNATQCEVMDSEPAIKSNYCTPERHCKYMICNTFILGNSSSVEFALSGEVQFKDLDKYNVPFLKRYTGENNMVDFKSFLYVTFDEAKYVLDSENPKRKHETLGGSRCWDENYPTMKSSEVQIELIVVPDKIFIIGTGAGFGFLFLIIITIIMFKLGCFKRKMRDMVLEEEENAAGTGGVINGTANQAPKTQDTPKEDTQGKEDAPKEDTQGKEDASKEDTQGKEDAPKEDTQGKEDAPKEDTQGKEDTSKEDTQGKEDAPKEDTQGKEDAPKEDKALLEEQEASSISMNDDDYDDTDFTLKLLD